MTQPWEQPVTGGLAQRIAALHVALPVILTPRLRLRPARIEDHATYAAIYGGPRWMHDDPVTAEDIWLDFCQLVAGWLMRGLGLMAIEARETGALQGFVLLNHEYGDAEMELGLMLTEAAEGQGIAFEAAEALRAHGASLGVRAPVSYIAPGNTRSARLAERLGARRDAAAEAAAGGEVLVYRHPAGEVRP